MTHIDVEHWMGIALISIAPICALIAALYYTARFLRALPAWIKRNEL